MATTSGDLNGDGYSEIIVSASSNDDGGTNAGAVYVIYGRGTALAGNFDLSAADATLVGEDAGDNTGWGTGTGDIDADGYDDLVIGSPNGEADDSGHIHILYGSSTPFASYLDLATADATYLGENANDALGWSNDASGDMDGDGYHELLMSASTEDGGGIDAGAVYLNYGSPSQVLGVHDVSTVDAKFIGEAADDRLSAATSIGDVDGDGFDDFLIGAHQNDDGGNEAGAAYLIYGGAVRFSGIHSVADANAIFVGEASGDWAGRGVLRHAGGDVNGDGYSDFVVGATGADNGGSDAGAIYLYYGESTRFVGRSSLALAPAVLIGEQSGDEAGWAFVNDIDGDNLSDIIITAPYEDTGGADAGAVYVYRGSGI
jgi:hypothetical protein